tara:strand:+ start:1286 stop:1807 length:522 start_codon:yes stop_codon:yes gene_type:complete
MVKNRKAQTEILGLAIIILLILVATVFVAKFFLNSDRESSRSSVVASELASDLIKSVLNTDSSCRNLKYSAIFRSCSESRSLPAPCTPSDPCQYLNSKLNEELLKETFDEWKIKYQLKLYNGEVLPQNHIPELNIQSFDCDSPSSSNPKESTYSLSKARSTGTLNIRLILCQS